MALQLFQESERVDKSIIVVKRNEVPGSMLNKSLKSVMKLRTFLEWKDPPEGKRPSAKTMKTFVQRLRMSLSLETS